MYCYLTFQNFLNFIILIQKPKNFTRNFFQKYWVCLRILNPVMYITLITPKIDARKLVGGQTPLHYFISNKKKEIKYVLFQFISYFKYISFSVILWKKSIGRNWNFDLHNFLSTLFDKANRQIRRKRQALRELFCLYWVCFSQYISRRLWNSHSMSI